MVALAFLALIATAPVDTARGPVVARASEPVRTVVYPISARREGRWQVQRIAIVGHFGASLPATLRDALPDSLLGAHERMVMAFDLAGQLRWQVDFLRDISPGDRYAILFDRFLGESGEVRYGRLLAAELALGPDEVTAFAFDAPDGRILYFDADGRALERAFLSSPVDFEKVSSGFSRARFHPVLRRWRAHEGIDYAADRGTPVHAVAEGTVARAGWNGGYGRLVEIRHADGIITRYAHLDAIGDGIQAGTTVSQGRVIGTVGASGLATGPHLHYELRVNGRATDPRRLPRDGGRPLDENDRIPFVLQQQKLRQYLAVHETEPAELAASAP